MKQGQGKPAADGECRESETAPDLELERFLPYRLSVLTNRVSRLMAREYESRYGIGVSEWRAMAVLGREAALSAGEVAERTSMDKVRVSRAVAALLRKGFVERRRDPVDQRVARLSLTARGEEVYRRVAALALAFEARLLAGFHAEERRRLFGFLKRRDRRVLELGAEP